MASPRPAEREAHEAMKEAARKMAEESSRAARTAAEAGAGVARVGADVFQRNAELATELVEQSMQRFSRTFGIGGENAHQAAQQSARNAEAIMQSSTIIAGGMQSISRELLEFARKRMAQNLQMADAVMGCRTPQEFIAAQSNLVRDNLEDFVQSTRRIAEISMQMADEAARRVSNTSQVTR
jgi:phasin family protein